VTDSAQAWDASDGWFSPSLAAQALSFPNSVWERRPRNSVSRLPPGTRRAAAKQSFAKIGSQTEFGNQEN